MLLTRDEILSADDLRSERVQVPEWGGEVIVREMTGSQRDEWEGSVVRRVDDDEHGEPKVIIDSVNMRAKLVALCVVGEDDKPLFTLDDVEALGRKSGKALDRVVDAAKTLSKIADSDLADLGKGSASTGSDASAST